MEMSASIVKKNNNTFFTITIKDVLNNKSNFDNNTD